MVSGAVRLRWHDDFVFPPKRGDRRNGFLRGRVPDYRLLTWVDIESATPTSSPGCCCCYRRGWPPPPRENVRLAGWYVTPTRRKVGQSRFIHPLIHKCGRKSVRVARGRWRTPILPRFVYNGDPSPYHGRDKTLRLLRDVPLPASTTVTDYVFRNFLSESF